MSEKISLDSSEFICIFFIARIGFSYEIHVIVSRVI